MSPSSTFNRSPPPANPARDTSDTLAGKPGQALLAQTASGLFFELASMDPLTRPATLSTTIQVDGHQTPVTVSQAGTVNFHDIDPGVFGTVLGVIGIKGLRRLLRCGCGTSWTVKAGRISLDEVAREGKRVGGWRRSSFQ